MNIVGIDPGQNGGICFIQHPGKIKDVKLAPLPMKKVEVKKDIVRNRLDGDKLVDWLEDIDKLYGIDKVFIEEQICIKGQGISSTSTTMEAFGILQGVCVGMNLRYGVIAAKIWQEHFFGKGYDKDTKTLSRATAAKIAPNISFLRTSRSKTPDHGLTDAFLISYYGCLIDE